MQISYAFLSAALNVALVCATVSSAWLVWRLARRRSSQAGSATAVFLALVANIVILIGLFIVARVTARLPLGTALTGVLLTYASVIAAYLLCVGTLSMAPIARSKSGHRLGFFGLVFAPALVAALHLLTFSAWVDCWSFDSKNPLCDFFSDRPGLQG